MATLTEYPTGEFQTSNRFLLMELTNRTELDVTCYLIVKISIITYTYVNWWQKYELLKMYCAFIYEV